MQFKGSVHRGPRRRHIAVAAVLVAASAATVGVGSPAVAVPGSSSTVFINELHYDNASGDVGEFFEIAGPAGTDLAGWSVELYNGSNGSLYGTESLSGVIADEGSGYGTISVALPTNGLQNGSPDGLALIDASSALVQFLSYEGTLVATGGTASGQTSTDIGVSETSSTPIGSSLQLTGSGTTAGDFSWTGPASESPGAVNVGQSFGGSTPSVKISEIHYDNSGTDVGEFVEVEGPAGTDLTGWSLELYNGSNGASYGTIALSGSIDDEGTGSGAVDFAPPSSIQNGPDAVALVDDTNTVIEFVSYEGTFAATDGPAAGLTSTDLGVSETSATPIGQSIQLLSGVWTGPAPASPGVLNTPPSASTELIHDIQGNGTASPLVGSIVTIEGIVVGDFQTIVTGDPVNDEPLEGFFVQEEDADADADPATSEGIFVYAPGGTSVAVNDLVSVTGTVTEFFTQTQIASVTDITVVSSGNTAPTPATPTVPTAVGDPVVDWEAIEGMSVSFSQSLFVTGLFPLGSFGEVQLSAIGAQDHPNQTNPVGSAAAASQRQLNLDSRVVLDDGEDENESFPSGLSSWNPEPTPFLGGPDNTLRSGDEVTGLNGVVNFAFGEYEVLPVNTLDPNDPDGAVTINRTPRPAGVPAVGGDLTVASFNVLNYFVTIDTGSDQCGPPSNPADCRGADTVAEFDLQSAKIVAALTELDADIVGLVELENSATDAAVADLVTKVNAASTRTYAYVATGFIGTDAITVGLMYDTATVTLDGGFAVLDSSVSPAYIDDKNRPTLAQTFEHTASGESLTVSVSHLKSKGSSCDDVSNPGDAAFGVAPYGAGIDVEDPNFQGNCNLTRAAAASVLGQWMDADPTGSGAHNAIILGDINAYANEDPVTTLEGLGWSNVVETLGTGNSWADGGHSYVFDGEHGSLDYALANTALSGQVTGAATWHINADEPFALDYQNFNPPGQAVGDEFKSSDHDPVVVGLDLEALPVILPGAIGGPEGDTGSQVAMVPVTLDKAWSTPITVEWATFDTGATGLATPGLDYIAASGTAVFPAGVTEVFVPITVLGDTIDEVPFFLGEWVPISFTNPSANATIDTSFGGLGVVIIGDDD